MGERIVRVFMHRQLARLEWGYGFYCASREQIANCMRREDWNEVFELFTAE